VKRDKLTQAQMDTLRSNLNGTGVSPWSVVDHHLRKSFEFRDFNAAFGFMTRCALVAEAMDHHPDWRNSYRRVDVELTTHSAGGLTELDFELARKMDTIAGEMGIGS
jgi:4a-hydroxytetrahydrobiopterin dehydratase